MTRAPIILRGARWSELLFGAIALLLALGLPLDRTDLRSRLLLVHWYGLAIISLGLVVALRRPSRTLWLVASAVSVYALASIAVGIVGWRSGATGGSSFVLSPLLVGLAALAQISVAIRCWQARDVAAPEP